MIVGTPAATVLLPSRLASAATSNISKSKLQRHNNLVWPEQKPIWMLKLREAELREIIQDMTLTVEEMLQRQAILPETATSRSWLPLSTERSCLHPGQTITEAMSLDLCKTSLYR